MDNEKTTKDNVGGNVPTSYRWREMRREVAKWKGKPRSEVPAAVKMLDQMMRAYARQVKENNAMWEEAMGQTQWGFLMERQRDRMAQMVADCFMSLRIAMDMTIDSVDVDIANGEVVRELMLKALDKSKAMIPNGLRRKQKKV